MLIILYSIISTDEDPSLRIESSAIINLRGVSTKLNKYMYRFHRCCRLNYNLVIEEEYLKVYSNNKHFVLCMHLA